MTLLLYPSVKYGIKNQETEQIKHKTLATHQLSSAHLQPLVSTTCKLYACRDFEDWFSKLQSSIEKIEWIKNIPNEPNTNDSTTGSSIWSQRSSGSDWPLVNKISVNDYQRSSFYFKRNEIFLVITWRWPIKVNPIFISKESPHKAI